MMNPSERSGELLDQISFDIPKENYPDYLTRPKGLNERIPP
jgi:hypothetical protein